MARPKKAPADLRDERLNPRLTTAERAEIERNAAALGLSPSEFIRRRALGYRMPPTNPEQRAMTSLAAALMPIGVNLNQLTRAANAGRLLPHSVAEVTDRIAALLEGFYGSGPDKRRTQL